MEEDKNRGSTPSAEESGWIDDNASAGSAESSDAQRLPLDNDLGKAPGDKRLIFSVTAVVFVCVYLFLLFYIQPKYLLSLTTTNGGDTGAHHYVAKMMIEQYLPQGKLFGWAQGWYAGMPMLSFYWTFPFLLIALLSYVIPYMIAFKLITMIGVFLMPLLVYVCFRALKFEHPMPVLGAIFTLPFLFLEYLGPGELYSIFGGNILSTLAGEFSFTLSFALTFLFLGVLVRGISERRFIVLGSVILSVLTLSHLITTFFLVLLGALLVIGRTPLYRLYHIFATYFLTLLFTAFWSIPFLANLKYTAHVEWNQVDNLALLFPPSFWPILPFAILGLIGAVLLKDIRMLPFFYFSAVSFLLIALLPDGRMFNGRFFGFWCIGICLWAAYGVFISRAAIWSEPLQYLRIPKRYSEALLPLFIAPLIGLMIFLWVALVPHWVKWNYEGYEGKPAWSTYNEINKYFDSGSSGRVMVEHADGIDQFGTPRAFELIPYFTNDMTMEGTLMEASLTSPYHFYMQAEVSDKPSNAIQGIDYPPYNLSYGINHMQMFNIKYFLVVSDRTKKAAAADPRLQKTKSFGFVDIYKLKRTDYVDIAYYEPVEVIAKDWRSISLSWFSDPLNFDRHIYTKDMNRPPTKKEMRSTKVILASEDIKTTPKKPILQNGEIHNFEMDNDHISFKTSAIGVPHIVKVSYFPNWKAYGAEGPYLVSPSFMMVIPTQKNVILRYEANDSDRLGVLLSSVAMLIYLFMLLRYIQRRNFLGRNEKNVEDIEQIKNDRQV